MTSPTRVRFAPSPTGFMHVGGARVALFNWLYARSTGGAFLLRIEDTDRERSEARYTHDFLDSLSWLGLNWDEEPIYQSRRTDIYSSITQDLLDKKLAYRCDCTPDELNAIRAQCEKEKRPFRYPGICKNKTSYKGPTVVRLATPKQGEITFEDQVRGSITLQCKDLDDWVIQRTNGSPTYNFAVVIDDHDQRITHVIRGDDHINNTPKQIHLYQTLNYQVPLFAHLPMILGTDKTKLSKRHGAASVLEYRTMGFLPSSLNCFLVRLGWSHGDQEIFTTEELIKYFTLTKIGKAPAVFNPEKLNWISGHFMKNTTPGELRLYLKKYFSHRISFMGDVSDELIDRGIGIIQSKVKNCIELTDQLQCLFGPDPAYTLGEYSAEDKKRMKDLLIASQEAFSEGKFSKEELEKSAREVADKFQQKLAVLAQALRLAVTGGKISPGLFEMLEIQGKEKVLRRINNTIQQL